MPDPIRIPTYVPRPLSGAVYLRVKGAFEANMSRVPEYITDGHMLLVAERCDPDIADALTAHQDTKQYGRGRINEIIDDHTDHPTAPATFVGQLPNEDVFLSTIGLDNVGFVQAKMEDGWVTILVNAHKWKLITTALTYDAVYATGKTSPILFYADQDLAGMLMPLHNHHVRLDRRYKHAPDNYDGSIHIVKQDGRSTEVVDLVEA